MAHQDAAYHERLHIAVTEGRWHRLMNTRGEMCQLCEQYIPPHAGYAYRPVGYRLCLTCAKGTWVLWQREDCDD